MGVRGRFGVRVQKIREIREKRYKRMLTLIKIKMNYVIQFM